MNHPTVICILFATLFMSLAPYPAADTSDTNTLVLSPQEIQLRDQLWAELKTDGLASTYGTLVIEFEYHDLFINEEIPEYGLMLKYQRLLRSYGIQPGPQRQIHLFEDGQMLIGDFDNWGDLLNEPVRLGLAVASN